MNAAILAHDDRRQRAPEILVVDDDEMVRDVVVESIKAVGFSVDVCGNGAEALLRNETQHYDLIITDMRLPGVDGLTLIKKLKADQSNTDVMVITGFGTVENAVECMKAGAVEYLIKPFTVDQIQVAVKRALEVRELRRQAKEREFYKELSYVDALTGVRNRRYFDEALAAELDQSCRSGSSLVLLLIDIDDFKLYNDMNGHQRGDEALAKIGELFKSTCRGYDIVTRYGGEEFAILFPGVTIENALVLAQRVLQEVRKTKFEGADKLPSGSLTVSIGVACCPVHAHSAKDLVRCADQALYDAKRAGKNMVQMCSIEDGTCVAQTPDYTEKD
jgi:diguanylate cyclase (GGDEF)-like protein